MFLTGGTLQVDVSSLIIVSISVIGFLISCLSCLVGIAAFIELRTFRKSTHQVQYMPIDPKQIDAENESYLKDITSDESIQKQNKLYRENLEEVMPEFASSEEDLERYSF